jgi:hypothetical protein
MSSGHFFSFTNRIALGGKIRMEKSLAFTQKSKHWFPVLMFFLGTGLTVMSQFLVRHFFAKQDPLDPRHSTEDALSRPRITSEESDQETATSETRSGSTTAAQEHQRFLRMYQDALPLIHLTLISVLQAVVLTTLMEEFPLPNGSQRVPLLQFFLGNYLYLPYIISSLLIIMIWKISVYSNAFPFWPLSTLRILFVYLITLVEILAFKEITTFPLWAIGLGCLSIIGGLSRFNNLRFFHDNNFEMQFLGKEYIQVARKRQMWNGFAYIFLGVAIVGLGVASNIIDSQWPEYSQQFTWALLTLFFAITCLGLLNNRKSHMNFLRYIAEGTAFKVLPNGVLSDKSKTGNEGSA